MYRHIFRWHYTQIYSEKILFDAQILQKYEHSSLENVTVNHQALPVRQLSMNIEIFLSRWAWTSFICNLAIRGKASARLRTVCSWPLVFPRLNSLSLRFVSVFRYEANDARGDARQSTTYPGECGSLTFLPPPLAEFHPKVRGEVPRKLLDGQLVKKPITLASVGWFWNIIMYRSRLGSNVLVFANQQGGCSNLLVRD